MTDHMPPPESDVLHAEPAPRPALPLPHGWYWWLAPVVPAALALYLAAGMALTHIVDADGDFGPGMVVANQSRAVAMTTRLVFREVDQHKWTANDPFFQPGWWLDNMSSFQQGIVAAGARFSAAMSEASDKGQGRDRNLERAAGLLKYPGTVWKFDPSTSWAPTASAEKQYRNAARSLDDFNQRLAMGDAQFEHRADILALILGHVAQDLAASSTIIDDHLAEGRSALFDTKADDIFFAAKGRLYAYSLILRELGADHSQILGERDLGADWRAMLDSLAAAARLDPCVVVNGAPDATLLPSHLTAQGFHLLRARARLMDIAQALRH